MVELFHSTLYLKMDIASYLVFHNVAEFFSVMVSLSIFGLGWHSYGESKDQHALFLSTAFLAIGLMDFMHTLGYAGMPAFITPNSPNKSTQFWIAVRFLTASAFLASAYVYSEKPNRWLSKVNLIIAAFTVCGLVFIGITFFPSDVPATFIEGIGLTPFKKNSEYLIICLFLLAFVVYWKRMSKTGDRLIIYYLAAFVLCIFSEFVFAVYKSVFDTYNVLGHVYKVLAFYLIYKGIFVSSIKNPYEKLIDINDKLQIEIAERMAAEAALQASNEEIKIMSHQLLQVEKLATMGELASSIAHELNNPLATVSIRVESLIAQSTGDDPRLRELGIIGQEVERMGNLVTNLLQFCRRSKPQISTVSICDEIEKTLELVHYHLRKRNIVVAREFKLEGTLIHADRQQLRQLFLNLFTNASDAMPEGGTLTIRVTARPEEKQIRIEIADTGVGIPPEVLSKVLEPFYTTKPEGKGTGLGLPICRRITEGHGGTLNIISEGGPGNGTRVCITLPFSNGSNSACLRDE